MITPEEYNEIVGMPDDLAFLTLETKYRRSLNQRHPRAEGEAHFPAMMEYVNHTTTAARALSIENGDIWESNLSHTSGQQNIHEEFDDLIGRVDRFIVRTRIRHARSGTKTTELPIFGSTPSSADESGTFGSTSLGNAFQQGAFQSDAFQQGVFATSTEGIGLADSFTAVLTDESGRHLQHENGNRLLVDIDPTDNLQITAHANLQQSVNLLRAALAQWPINPGMGHNNPPDQFDLEIESDDIKEIENLIDLLKSEPTEGSLPATQLTAEVAKARPIFERLKHMGDSYLTKFAESAGTESGKIFSPTGVIAISLALYLGQVVQAANIWISTLIH